MNTELTPILTAGIAFAYIGGTLFTVIGLYLSIRRRRLHPLLLVCISALSISWIEAPYDWAMFAQFPPAIPRMPSWWPLNATYGGLPSAVPIGYISYFVLPPFIGVGIGRLLIKKYGWSRPKTYMTVGFVAGFLWAMFFNAFVGAQLGVFHYGKVIPGLAIREGSKHQYPIYDAVAMAIQIMVFTYILGRTDEQGRTIIDMWTESKVKNRVQSTLLSVLAVIVLGISLYGAVFAPHLITKLGGYVTAGTSEQLFPGVDNQPDK